MFGKLNRPALSVVVDRSNWLTGLWISMVAPGTTAPDGSATTPLSDEFPVVCALALMTPSAKQNIATAIALINLYCKGVWLVSCVEIISSPISLASAIVLSPRNKMRGSMPKAMENARIHAPEDAP